MECHVTDLYSHSLHLSQQILCKVQAGGRCCGRADFLGIDSLVTLRVFQFFLNVGRQRHLSQPFQYFEENALIVELNQAVSVRQNLHDLCGQFAFTERKLTEVREGDDRDYLQGSRDIHEDALDLQRRVREVYLAAAAKDDSLRVVDCSDPSGAMGSPEHNFEKIRAVLAPILDAR